MKKKYNKDKKKKIPKKKEAFSWVLILGPQKVNMASFECLWQL